MIDDIVVEHNFITINISKQYVTHIEKYNDVYNGSFALEIIDHICIKNKFKYIILTDASSLESHNDKCNKYGEQYEQILFFLKFVYAVNHDGKSWYMSRGFLLDDKTLDKINNTKQTLKYTNFMTYIFNNTYSIFITHYSDFIKATYRLAMDKIFVSTDKLGDIITTTLNKPEMTRDDCDGINSLFGALDDVLKSFGFNNGNLIKYYDVE
jgi:hypothetical protein